MEKGKVKIFRYDPEKDKAPRYETHEYPFEAGMSVLDVAIHIYEEIDGTFSFSYCCRNSHCGLCGVKINGRPGLMCRESATREMTLEPLDHLSHVRDLMVDRNQYEDQMTGLRLFLDRVAAPDEEPEKIEKADHDRFKVVSRCVECYNCVSTCTSFRENPHDFLGPAGIVQLARHAFDPRDELNREVMAYEAGVYHCTLCDKCTVVCPHGISPRESIEILRARLVSKSGAPRALKQVIDLVKESSRAIAAPKRKKPFLQEHARSQSGKVALFIGCNMDYDPNLMPIALSAAKVLLHLGVDLSVPEAQVCCGMPLVEVGATDMLEGLIIQNVEAFIASGCETVLTLCSGCGLTAKQRWPKIYEQVKGEKPGFKVLDFTEFIADLPLGQESLKALNLKVSYHDPCLLIRGQGIHEQPRQLLQAVPDLAYREMPEADYCCGGGGVLRLSDFEMSGRILKTKIDYLKDLDLDAIATCCPTCIKHIKIGLSRARMRQVKIVHVANILAQSLGLE
jgi:fumarate reductase (CoM/CoB) subunit B